MEVDIMKSKRWIWITLTVLLTLIVLAGVAAASYRMGAMRSTILVKNVDGTTQEIPIPGHMRGFDNNFNDQHGSQQFGMQGFDHGAPMMRGGRGGFASPLFGLFHIAVMFGLIWLGYTLMRNSGWRLTRTTAAVPAPVAAETPSVEGEEKKE